MKTWIASSSFFKICIGKYQIIVKSLKTFRNHSGGYSVSLSQKLKMLQHIFQIVYLGLFWNFQVYTSSIEPDVVLTTAWPHQISEQMLTSHSIVSLSRTVRPCSPWRGRWIRYWRTTWSTVCCSASHSQAAEEAIPPLYKQKWKRQTPVRRRLSWTQALLGRVTPGGERRCQGWKCGVLWGCPSTPPSVGNRPSAPHVCCCCQINWWVVVRRVQMGVSIWGAVHLHSMDGWALSGADVQAPWLHAESPDQRMQATPNRAHKVNGWSCSFQQWPRRLGCNHLCTSYTNAK